MTAATPITERDSPISSWALWPLVLGFAVLAIPTVISLAGQVWTTEAGAHGPIVLVTGAWLLWRKAKDFSAKSTPGSLAITLLVLLGALSLYTFGRAFDFMVLEVAGLYGVGVSALYSQFGFSVLRRNWFPLLYLAFLVPLPGWLMDTLTAPLKLFVSYASTTGLQAIGLPVFREGVTLSIGNYQLLVEDACSGMNSLVGLIAISLFYIYLLRNASWRYSLLLVAFVVPIAIIANIVRVSILVILTYFFGDAVAQGFMHTVAGLLLFVTALMLVFLVDSVVSRLFHARRSS